MSVKKRSPVDRVSNLPSLKRRNEPRGLLHLLLGAFGVKTPPEALTSGTFLGITWWDWLAGPSVAWSAFILMAAIQRWTLREKDEVKLQRKIRQQERAAPRAEREGIH